MPANIHLPFRPEVRIVHTSKRDGDFHPARHDLTSSRERVSRRPWTQLTEDHGVEVRRIDQPGHLDGAPGDVLLTDVPGAVLGVWVGDCAPIVIVGDRCIAGVHAGWRGLRDGVLPATFDAIRTAGDEPRAVVVGAHIGPCCYEFGPNDLNAMHDVFGPTVRGVDRRGRPALDVGACIRVGVATLGSSVSLIESGTCTGCRGDLFWSHRVRREAQRQVMAVWTEST